MWVVRQQNHLVVVGSTVVPTVSDKFTISTGKFPQFVFKLNLVPETEFAKLQQSKRVCIEWKLSQQFNRLILKMWLIYLLILCFLYKHSSLVTMILLRFFLVIGFCFIGRRTCFVHLFLSLSLFIFIFVLFIIFIIFSHSLFGIKIVFFTDNGQSAIKTGCFMC